MSDLIFNIAMGFEVALTPTNLLFAFIGCLGGTLIGILPGIGPVSTVAMLVPVTFGLEPVSGIIMLAGIFYGAQYGGSTTAILVNMPGEASAVVTCLDGYQMARQGRAGPALAIAAIGSFFAGSFATVLIAVAAPPLTLVAENFGAPEYFSLMLLGLIGSVVLAHGSVVKAIAMIFLGLLLGTVGLDTTTGDGRFLLGQANLMDGINFVALAIGLFGLSEIISNLVKKDSDRTVLSTKLQLWPTKVDFRKSWPAIFRGTGLGALLGILPGGGATLSSFTAYVLEKKCSRTPEAFGTGAIEGVAAPESANNAGAQTSFIPLLTLGIPGNATIALLAGALTIHGIQPGPQVMRENPDLFWGLIASMWIGNLMLVIINLPMLGLWVRLLKIPYEYLFPAILLFCAIGVYGVNNSVFDVFVAALFGFVGYLFIRLNCEPAPLLLGFILGPMVEDNLRRSMLISRGDPMIFLSRPISAGFLIAAFALLVILVLPNLRRTREVAFQE